MKSLVESILSLEEEANGVLESIHAEAEAIEEDTAAKIQAIQDEAAANVAQRVAAFREQATKKHEQDIADAARESQQALHAVAQVSGDLIQTQAQHIVQAFCEL